MTLSLPTFGLETIAIIAAVAFALGTAVGSAAVVTSQQWKQRRSRG
ncbi:hypothetical protein NPS53_08945 [Pseudomonas putida]|nr:hypothetical protein [Pseudomonas putida]MDD2139701.1 hypothetical protein [Pseudomonas putida]HDS1721625.1 hypothetical protein [Pseudomonas putida]